MLVSLHNPVETLHEEAHGERIAWDRLLQDSGYHVQAADLAALRSLLLHRLDSLVKGIGRVVLVHKDHMYRFIAGFISITNQFLKPSIELNSSSLGSLVEGLSLLDTWILLPILIDKFLAQGVT